VLDLGIFRIVAAINPVIAHKQGKSIVESCASHRGALKQWCRCGVLCCSVIPAGSSSSSSSCRLIAAKNRGEAANMEASRGDHVASVAVRLRFLVCKQQQQQQQLILPQQALLVIRMAAWCTLEMQAYSRSAHTLQYVINFDKIISFMTLRVRPHERGREVRLLQAAGLHSFCASSI
jgi:hypothetical protein